MDELKEYKINRIVFRDDQNFFTIISMSPQNGQGHVTAKGYFSNINEGMVFNLSGDWINDAKWGRQFIIKKHEEILPTSKSGIFAYLSAGCIKGIGKVNAKAIVDRFGDRTFEMFDKYPDELLNIHGIGPKKLMKIKRSWEEQSNIRSIMIFLSQFGISQSAAARIYKEYGNDSIRIIRDNPYRLANDIHGYGFKIVDAIALKFGIAMDSKKRVSNGLIFLLKTASQNGHVYLEEKVLLDEAEKLLSVEKDRLTGFLNEMYKDQDLFRDTDMSDNAIVYLPSFYIVENRCASKLLAILQTPADPPRRKVKSINKKDIAGIAGALNVDYDEYQEQAIYEAISEKITILTGGPGTGKTTTLCGIIKALKLLKRDFMLAAPTGRAAKRMTEVTGEDAYTIHRLLEYGMEGFGRDEDNPLECDVVIIDETSMVDLMLFYSLLRAIRPNMQIIFSGDIDQLPSVGAGNVLRDLINSEKIKVISLTKIFRQAQGSRIVTNAHLINQGKFPELNGGADSDFFFKEIEEVNQIAEAVVTYASKNLPKYYKTNHMDIQILTPMRKGEIGVVELNKKLQEAMNPVKPDEAVLNKNGYIYHAGDKVMQIKNDYDKGVFNGDVGYIKEVNKEDGELIVDFDDGNLIAYQTIDLDDLVLAYAVTVHKSQGTEYPIVVIPVSMDHFIMLQRNLIYTAVTRAKQVILMIGQKRALKMAIDRNIIAKRNTLLGERLKTGRITE